MTMTPQGIDGAVEFVAELDRLSLTTPVAITTPRGTGASRFLGAAIDDELRRNEADGPYWRLVTVLIERLSIWWPIEMYRGLPVMTPWCIRDRSARYDQGPEMWGAPRADGYFRDDNSIIKKLPLPLTVVAPIDSPYAGRKPWRGFTACHIWRLLEDNEVAGADPWLYSFAPNLVWLPKPLAPLTDHHWRVQALLQHTSVARFRSVDVAGRAPWTEYAWSRLASGTRGGVAEGLDLHRLASFRAGREFVRRRLAYVDRFVAGADEVLSVGRLTSKLVSSRYTAGLPGVGREELAAFRSSLASYAHAVRVGSQL